jgi:hypothetical protein
MTSPDKRSTSETVVLWAKYVYKIARLKTRFFLGEIINQLEVPGLVRDCDYGAKITDAHIKVRVQELFTIVQVNGLDIYFRRLTGEIDGVGFTPCCTQDQTRVSEFFPEPPEPSHRIVHKRNA